MNILKNLFGGGGGSRGRGDGMYFYVRPRGCEEVIEVRINLNNDLSIDDNGSKFVRKTVRGSHRCFNPVEMVVYFDANLRVTNSELDKGEFVDEETYNAWAEKLAAKKSANKESSNE